MPTIQSLLHETPHELRLETELLMAEAMNWSRSKVLAFSETEISEKLLPALSSKLDRLNRGEPFAYITGSREFYGLDFEVTPDVLIPRPDTELLVDLALSRCAPDARVVDLGTGSGAIAVSLAHERADLAVTASDVSDAALDVARRNAARHGCTIKCVASHWFESLNKEFDVIVSNPPYVRRNDPHLQGLAYEPSSALIAGDDGLADIRIIAAEAKNKLAAGGALLIEHGYDQAAEVAELFKQHGFVNVALYKDLADQPRVTSGDRPE